MSAVPWFDRQKSTGDAGERRVMDVFLRAGMAARWRYQGARRDLEIGFPTGTELIEVKNEDRFEQSPSLCIEMFQGLKTRKPSGLATSESTIFVHTFWDQCLVYRTQPMRLHIEEYLSRGVYTLQPFGKSDNGNGGVLVTKMIVALRPWCEMLAVEGLPGSRVFNPLEAAAAR